MDKQVNVKITANTSKFKKAISDATKSLDKFKKSGEKAGKTNIDKNLNKQFKNVSKESKKTDKQFKQNIKNLKDLSKSKLDKLNKQFSNMTKTVKDNSKVLQSLQKTLNNLKSKSIEAINKALTSMSKGASVVSKGFTNIKNVMNNLSNKAIEAIGKSLTNIKDKCPTVANGFSKIKDTINNISGKAIETVRSALDKIKEKCPTVANGFNNIKNKINDIKAGVFSTLSSKLDGIKTKASDAGNKFKDLKSRISDAARQSLQKLTDSTAKLNEEGTRSGNVFSNFDNKIKSLTSGALGGLGSKMGLVISSTGRMGSTFATTAAQVALVTTATKTLTNTNNNAAKSNKQLTQEEAKMIASIRVSKDTIEIYKGTIKKAEQEIKKLSDSEKTNGVITKENAQKMQAFQEQINKLNDKIKAEEENIKKQTQAFRNSTQATKENAKAEDTLKNSTEKASNSAKKLVSGTQTLRSATGNLREQLKGAAKATKEVSDAQKKAEDTTKSFGDKVKKLSESLNETFKKLNKGDFGGAFNSLKSAGKAAFALMPGWVKMGTAVIIVLKKLYDAGKKNFFEGLTNIKNALQPVMNIINGFIRSIRTSIETVTGARFDLASNIAGVIEFDYAIQRAGATCKASQEQIVQLSDRARELGASTKFSSAEVADAFYYMALAGWDTTSMLDAIDEVLNLANVSGMDLAKTCDIVTDYLSTFGRSSKDAADFCNYMAATSTSTNTTVEQLAEAYSQCAGAASEFGVTQSFLNTQLGILANSGKKSGPAGVVLKNMYTNLLSPPSDDAFKAYKKWGIYIDDKLNPALTRTNELTGEQQLNGEALTKQLQKQYKAYTNVSDKAKMLKMIYGKLALSGGAILLGADEFDYERLELVQKTSDSYGAYLNQQNKIIDSEGKLVNANGEVINSTEDIDKKTRENINTFKEQYQVYEDFKDAQIADILGTTNTDIATTITMLGEAGITGAKRVEQFLNVVEAIKNPTEKVKKAVSEAGLSVDDLTKSFKYNEDGSLDLAGTMDNLLPILANLDKSTRDQMLKNMGLSDSIDEVDELIKSGSKNWSQRKEDIESVQTATEKMVEYFNGTLKDKLKGAMSALAEMFISAIYPCKEQITEIIDSFTHFFAAIGNIIKKNGKSTTEDLISISKDWGKWLEQGITNAIKGLENFVTGGGLDTVLEIGTNIITGICNGIIKNKESLTTAISEAIRKLCNWVTDNHDQVKEAGLTILKAIGDGIRSNKTEIQKACGSIYNIINDWEAENDRNIWDLGATVGLTFMTGFLVGGIQKGWAAVLGFIETAAGTDKKSAEKTTNTFSATADARDMLNKNKKTNNSDSISKSAKDAAKKTVGEYKKVVNDSLKKGDIAKNAAKEINKALDRGEEAKKGAWKTTKAYISELQSRLANGEIDTNTFDSLLEKLNMIDKAKSAADKASKAYYDTIEAGLMNGTIDPSAVDSILSSLEASDAIYKTASKDGKTYIDALRQQLASGQITPEQFYALVFSGDLEEAAKKYAETGKIEADDVIDAKSFSNVQEVNDLMDALDDLNEKYSKLSGTITDSCKKMADSTRSNFLGIANIVRNQMVNVANIVRNQMLNCTNITRNQFVNMSNIIKNQSSNARNNTRTHFVALYNIINTQISKAREIVTGKMISMRKVVAIQSYNAKKEGAEHFQALRQSIEKEMSAACSSVSSYMNKIARSTNRTLHTKVNVTKSVKTVDAGGGSALATAFSSLNAMALSGSGLTYAAAGTSSGVGISGAYNGNSNNVLYFELPTYLDGKVVAKTTAKYMNNELTILDKKNSRKRGNK